MLQRTTLELAGTSVCITMQSRLGCESSMEEDRISDLPDALIHHIFSFIDTINAVRAAVLSKRWRYIWTSLPTLNFKHRTKHWRGFMDFVNVVDKVINLRSNEVYDIQRFHLCYRYEQPRQPLTPYLDKWLLAAVGANVRDIDIDTLFSLDITDIPQCIFTCRTLSKLRLSLGYNMTINLPKSIDLPSLVYLKLDCLPRNGGELVTTLLLGSPIKDLDLLLFNPPSCTSDKFDIRSSTLKHLAIRGSGSSRITLSLDAPNLVSFLSALKTDVVSLGDVPFVVSAHIDTKPDVPARSPKAYPQYMLKCLEALPNVTDLTISTPPLQGDTGVTEFLENQLPQFRNLRRLKLLQTSYSSDSIYVIASMLKNSPNVESLSLEQYEDVTRRIRTDLHYSSDSDSSDSSSESDSINEMASHDDIDRLLSTPTLSNLKLVEISNMRGNDVELKFIEVLLRKANVLEKLYLVHGSKKEEYAKISKRFRDKIAAFPKASSSFLMLSQQ